MTRATVLMVQGTASHVGKSVLVAGLCRLFADLGYRVAPFKAQNMALNAYVTLDGAEVGRAQAEQAAAAGVELRAEMNPILLKPEADSRVQVVVLGQPWRSVAARDYPRLRRSLWSVIRRSLEVLRAEYDLVLIEGAGSPAEINLRQTDLVNMRVARYAGAPVLLVGDIDRGGVFASLYGTLKLLTSSERRLVRGLIINKFRGDPTLLGDGVARLERLTGRRVVGIVPYIDDLRVAAEDSVALEYLTPTHGDLVVAVPRLPRISNFDDFDPLRAEPDIAICFLDRPPTTDVDLIVLPGSKSTMADLEFLRRSGWADWIRAQATAGTPVLGICGGFQMLGQAIYDPYRVESERSEMAGLGLLPVVTVFSRSKVTRRVRAEVLADRGLLAGLRGMEVTGYEIHMGRSEGGSAVFRLYRSNGSVIDDGAVDERGLVFGTYLHGLFENPVFRRSLLDRLRVQRGLPPVGRPAPFDRHAEYRRVAEVLRTHLDMAFLMALVEEQRRRPEPTGSV
ncbi:MAG: cobyric acid synthase [Acidobacteria bacterium]|nr:cobyric acid synthase [Acidobacteriota bacterium]MDW7984395.1 cobyric acid synthase [Acidobacteriota bacterium]